MVMEGVLEYSNFDMEPEERDRNNRLLTIKEMCRLFDRTPMTIYLWRRDEGLPIVKIPGQSDKQPVRFKLNDVLKWAEAKGKELAIDASDLKGDHHVELRN